MKAATTKVEACEHRRKYPSSLQGYTIWKCLAFNPAVVLGTRFLASGKMKCYKIGKNGDNGFGCGIQWSRDRSFDGIFTEPVPKSEWNPHRDFRYEDGGIRSYGALVKPSRLTAKTISNLQMLWVVTTTKIDAPHDVLGDYSILMNNLALVSERLKDILEALDPALFEFVPIPNVWDTTTQAPVNGGPFYLANVITRIDAWDMDETIIDSIPNNIGGSINLLRMDTATAKRSKIANALIWRDPVTGHVLCTEVFRELLENAGVKGWGYYPLKVSDK